MMMTQPDRDEDDAPPARADRRIAAAEARVDAWLDAAGQNAVPAPLPDALMARLMADAHAEIPRPAVAAPAARAAPPRAGLGARLWEALHEAVAQLGGAPALALLGVVGGLGIMLGAYPPEAVLVLEDVIFGTGITLDFAALPLDFPE